MEHFEPRPEQVSLTKRAADLGHRAFVAFREWANKQDLNPVEGFGSSAIPTNFV